MEATTRLPTRTREYETIYLLRPDIDDPAASKVADRVQAVISKGGGTLTLVESWGRRRLAYPVQKFKRGIYVYLKYVGVGDIVSELERNLRISEGVLKYQTVKVRDEVDVTELKVSEDDVKFEAVGADEGESDETRERELGLDEASLAGHSRRRDEDIDDEPEDDPMETDREPKKPEPGTGEEGT